MRSRRTRALLAALAIVLALAAATWVALVRRPIADPEEIAAADAYATTAIADAASARCEREVLAPEAIEGDGTALLREIVDGAGPHAACYAMLRAHEDAVREALTLGAVPAEVITRELGGGDRATPAAEPDDPPIAEPWDSFAAGRAVRASALPIETQALEACAGVADAVSRAVAHRSVCAPWGLAFPPESQGVIPLARALALAARERIRRGDPHAAIALVLDGVRAFHDLSRGRSSIVAAMLGTASIGILVGQLETLLATELGWTDADVRDLQRRIEILARTAPTPDAFVRDDPVVLLIEALQTPVPAAGGWLAVELDESDAQLASILVAHRAALTRADLRCDGTLEDCLGAIAARSAAVPAAPDEFVPWTVVLTGVRPIRERLLTSFEAESMRQVVAYARRALLGSLAIRAQWIVLEHRRRMLAGGACPSARELASALGPIPTEQGLGGSFELLESGLAYRPIEIGAPAWMRPREETRPRVRLPVARIYCPAFAIVAGGP